MPRGSFCTEICHGADFSYGDKSHLRAFSPTRCSSPKFYRARFSLTFVLNILFSYRSARPATLRMTCSLWEVVPRSFDRSVPLSRRRPSYFYWPAHLSFDSYNIQKKNSFYAVVYLTIRANLTIYMLQIKIFSCRCDDVAMHLDHEKARRSFLLDSPEATIRAEFEKIAILTVRDGGLILGMIIAIVAVSRAIARLLLDTRT